METKIYRKSCKGCNKTASNYHYEDLDNIPMPVHICALHLAKHFEKYYPDSPIIKHLKNQAI